MLWEFIEKKLKDYEMSKIFDCNETFTYKELLETVKYKGDILREKAKPKSKCVILCEKGINSTIAILLCWYAGLIPIPMSMHYGIKHCENIIKLANPDLCIIDNDLGLNFDTNMFNITTNQIQYNNIINPFSEKILKDIAVIMYTSGTTGVPKGAMLTEGAIVTNVKNISKYFNINRYDTILISRPLYHCAVLTGELLISIFSGTNICFLDQKYNPSLVYSYIDKYKITVLCGTPTLLNHLALYYKHLDKISNIRILACSGECLTASVARNLRQIFKYTKIYNVYGLTEAGPRISYLDSKLFDTYLGSVGISLNQTVIRVIDNFNSKTERETGQIGLVIVRSPSIMKGYYNNEQLTLKVLSDGWLNTGDLGYIDSNGLLYICSREDDMIIKAGMNIYPQEIEESLKQLLFIDDVIAYGVKNTVGQVIAVDIVLNQNYKTYDKKCLLNKFAEILPMYLMPSQVNFVEFIKRNESGKKVRIH